MAHTSDWEHHEAICYGTPASDASDTSTVGSADAPAHEGTETPANGYAAGIRLHYVAAGPEDGPLVVLLHGFPGFWYSWREQLPALASAGYRVVAPDMRGYNRSEKPHGVESYRLERLVGDVVGLIDHLGADRAHLVGHDWGGIVAWETAMSRPEVVDRLAVLNAPHPYAFLRNLTLTQLWRSSYMLFFQLPWLPEVTMAAGDHASLDRLFREAPVHGFDDATIERYREAFSQPGATTSALDYYRALFRYGAPTRIREALPGLGTPREVTAETLVLWGEQDVALGDELLDGLDRWVPNLRIERIPDASHWVQTDAPERVNDSLRRFLDATGA